MVVDNYEDETSGEDMQYDGSDEEYELEDVDEEFGAAQVKENEQQDNLSPNTMFVKNYGDRPDISYKGPQEHGTLDQWLAAIKNGTDPKLNGFKYRNRQGFIGTSLASPSVYMNYAGSATLARTKSQAADNDQYPHQATHTLFSNEGGFDAGFQHPVSTHHASAFSSLGLNPEDDPFIDHTVHTPPYAPNPYDMAQQFGGNDTPPYHLNDYSDMSALYTYEAQGSHNSIMTSSGNNQYSQGDSDFVNASGKIYEDPQEQAGQSREMMDYGDGWNAGNSSQLDAHISFQDHGYQHPLDENGDNDHPEGLPSPSYVDYDDQTSYGGAVYHQ
jgi:hypothetical protein